MKPSTGVTVFMDREGLKGACFQGQAPGEEKRVAVRQSLSRGRRSGGVVLLRLVLLGPHHERLRGGSGRNVLRQQFAAPGFRGRPPFRLRRPLAVVEPASDPSRRPGRHIARMRGCSSHRRFLRGLPGARPCGGRAVGCRRGRPCNAVGGIRLRAHEGADKGGRRLDAGAVLPLVCRDRFRRWALRALCHHALRPCLRVERTSSFRCASR